MHKKAAIKKIRKVLGGKPKAKNLRKLRGSTPTPW